MLYKHVGASVFTEHFFLIFRFVRLSGHSIELSFTTGDLAEVLEIVAHEMLKYLHSIHLEYSATTVNTGLGSLQVLHFITSASFHFSV